jgi:hypothetical protein
MPFNFRDAREARGYAREAKRFATLLGTIPKAKDAPPHPEIRAAHASMKRINQLLAKRNAAGEVTIANRFRIGREFQRMGTALRKRPAGKRTARKRPARKR